MMIVSDRREKRNNTRISEESASTMVRLANLHNSVSLQVSKYILNISVFNLDQVKRDEKVKFFGPFVDDRRRG